MSTIREEYINFCFIPDAQNRLELFVWIDNPNGDLAYFDQRSGFPVDPNFSTITIVVEEATGTGNIPRIFSQATTMHHTTVGTNNELAIILVLNDSNGREIDRKRRNTSVKVTSGGGGS